VLAEIVRPSRACVTRFTKVTSTSATDDKPDEISEPEA
jgi:hypothetical protein